MVLRFARLQATTPGPGAAAKLEAEGAYDGNPFRLQGDVGPVADLVAGRPLPIRLDVHAGDADLKLDGRAGVAGAVGKGPELALQIAGGGPELAAFGAFAGARLPPLGPWRAGLHFSGSAGEMQLSGLKASVAGSDLAGDVTVEMDGPRPRVSGKLESSVLDLKSLAHSGAGKPAAAHSAGRVFPRTPIPVGFLNDLDGSIDYRAAKVLLPALELHHLALRARLADGSLTVDPVSMDLDPGSIRGSIGLARAQPGAAVRVNLKGEKLDAGSLLLKLAHSALLSGGDTSFALDVHGRGTSPAAVAGSLEGGAKLLMGPAQARATELDTLVGGASQMLGTLFARSSDTTRLNCAAADFHLVHGVAHSRLLLVDTQYSTVRGHGDIDLGHETLHLKVIPQPKSATLNVAVPVNVSGTLGDPKFAPDEFAAARKIGGILGVVLFPPAAIAGLTELGTGEANPCLNIAAGRSATAGAEQSPAGGSVVDKAAEGVKGAVQGIDSALKGLFGSGDGSGGATGGSGAATGRDLKGGH